MREVKRMESEDKRNFAGELGGLKDPMSQCEYLMELGLGTAEEPSIRTDQWKIGGCKTATWIRSCIRNGNVKFVWDSDSLLVRGVLAIMGDMYNGRSLSYVRTHPPEFLREISDDVIYPEIKENGVLKSYLKIAAFET